MTFAPNVMLAVFFGLVVIASSKQDKNDKPLSKGELSFLVSGMNAVFKEIVRFGTDANTPKDHIDKVSLQAFAELMDCTMDVDSTLEKGDTTGDGFWSLQEYMNFVTTFELPTEGTGVKVACSNPDDTTGGVPIHYEATAVFGILFRVIDKIDGKEDSFFAKTNLDTFLETRTIKKNGIHPKGDFFNFIDADGDGKVVHKEFVEYMSKCSIKMKKILAEVKKEATVVVKENKKKEL